MYRHKNCEGYIFVAQQIQTVSGLTVTPRGIISNGIGKIKVNLASTPTKLICSRCDKVVEPKEIESYCMQCGEFHTLEELFIPETSGGIYCVNCVKNFFPGESLTKVSIAIQKVA